MNHGFYGVLIAFVLFIGMLIAIELGRRAGLRQIANHPEANPPGIGVMGGAVFSLLGLLLAFTFSGAAARLDVRRQLIVQETNNIGTAYLRIDLLPKDAQPALRESFRRYVDTRIKTYRNSSIAAAMEEHERSITLQRQIWDEAVAAAGAENANPEGFRLFLPALNSMIDISTTQSMATKTHPPAIVFVMLAVLALISSLLAGYGLAQGKWRNWIHIICFAAVMSAAFYVILDLEFPRIGWIRMDEFDQTLVDLRVTMN
jgi:ABC-type glycerol-3-phosphate transport system permease component